MRILCVCSAGAKRSNYLAFVLKGMGFDAFAAGVDMNSQETLEHFGEWADMIVLAEPFMENKIPLSVRNKINRSVFIGPDIWADHTPQELITKCQFAANVIRSQV